MRSFLMDIVRVRQGSRLYFCFVSVSAPFFFSVQTAFFLLASLCLCPSRLVVAVFASLSFLPSLVGTGQFPPPSSPTLVKARRGGFLSLFHSFPLSLVGLFSSLRLYRCSKQASAVIMGFLSLVHSFPFPFVTGYFPLMPVQARDGFYLSLSSILSSL